MVNFEQLFYDLAARCVAAKIGEFVLRDCNGCKINHPSQRQHDCLMLLQSERIEMYFEEAWNALDPSIPQTLKPVILQRTSFYMRD